MQNWQEGWMALTSESHGPVITGYGSAKLKHILNKACRHRGAALVQGELGGGGRAGVVRTEPSHHTGTPVRCQRATPKDSLCSWKDEGGA